jgi:mannose-6-phosphate isomerase-like protein (cupin superfamily)
MNKQGKIWGYTQELFTKNNVSIHRIKINQDSCCSKHYHQHKHNIFYVESGKILVQEWKREYDLLDETVLEAGQMCSVPPMNYHKFVGLEDSVVYEIYYVSLDNHDITREDVGKEKI